MSKALANRIQTCIKEVVADDQTGFIRGRNIGTNLLNTQSIVDHADATGTPGILLALDFSKAFDTVRWQLIEKALQLFNFGEYILAVVRTLFSDIKSCIFNSGFSSGFFHPSRGIRQGCCASPSLFTLAVELLAIMARKNSEIRGISIGGHTAIISQYADDTTFFVRDYDSLEHLFDLMEDFTVFSGLSINAHKSHLILLGNFKDPPPASIRGIHSTDQVKILGMIYKAKMEEEDHYKLNFEARIQKIKQVCGAWINRSLSLKGKITLINALMLSILQYPIASSFTPTRVFSEVKKIVTDFLWNNGRSKIAYNLLIQDIQMGGLKLPDFQTRVHVSHISLVKRIWLNPNSIWASVMATALRSSDIKTSLRFKVNLTDLIPAEYTTFRQVLTTWHKYHRYQPKTEEEIRSEMLWQNHSITIERVPILWNSWNAAGIETINDILHPTEPRFLGSEELSAEYGVPCTFLDVYQIRAAVPFQWKRLITTAHRSTTSLKPFLRAADGKLLDISNSSSKNIYKAIVPFKLPTVSSQRKWSEEFPDMTDSRNPGIWKEVYTSPYIAARDTKLQAFQYRLVHRIVPCNKYLANIRIKADSTCSYCDSTDSLQHFFFSCQPVHSLWSSLSSWLAVNANIHVQLNVQDVLFGMPRTAQQATTVNFLLLFVKYYIYRQRLFHDNCLEFLQVLRELRLRLQVEKYVNIQENKPDKFRKWERIFGALG